MINLDEKIFGRVAAKEIIGSEPPLHPDTSEKLQYELSNLINELDNKSKDELEKMLQKQKEITKQMNSRPGSMAISQDKIKLFTDFSMKYTQEIENKLKSFLRK